MKEGKADVVSRTPFTIQLKHGSSGYKQDVTLGLDPGYTHLGMSAVTDRREVYASDMELRIDIVRLLSEKRQFRRARRSRKTRYRQPRFDNRARGKGWLAPSIQHKLDSMVKLVEKASKILPIARVKVEVAAFDTQKIKNPDIEGEEYQNGSQKGFSNVREYVLHRDNHTCRHCRGKSGDRILQTHHIVSRKVGGDRPENMLTVCKTCHDRHNKGEIVIKVKPARGFRAETFMTTIRWKLTEMLKEKGYNVGVTFGYRTKQKRFELGLSKSHINDAYVIADGNGQKRLSHHFYQKQVRKQNRKLFKGARSHIKNTAERIVKGFRRFDKVLYNETKCFVWGRRVTGYFALKTLNGITIHDGASWKELKLLVCANTTLTEVKPNSSTA